MKQLFLVLIMLGVSVFANAEDIFSGQKELVLLSNDKEPLVIGSIVFTEENDKVSYKMSLSDEVFRNEFLVNAPISMYT